MHQYESTMSSIVCMYAVFLRKNVSSSLILRMNSFLGSCALNAAIMSSFPLPLPAHPAVDFIVVGLYVIISSTPADHSAESSTYFAPASSSVILPFDAYESPSEENTILSAPNEIRYAVIIFAASV